MRKRCNRDLLAVTGCFLRGLFLSSGFFAMEEVLITFFAFFHRVSKGWGALGDESTLWLMNTLFGVMNPLFK